MTPPPVSFRSCRVPTLSGNFTKITQRLKVLIDIERDGKVLKPGMMVEVEIAI